MLPRLISISVMPQTSKTQMFHANANVLLDFLYMRAY